MRDLPPAECIRPEQGRASRTLASPLRLRIPRLQRRDKAAGGRAWRALCVGLGVIQPYDYSQTLQGVDRVAGLLDEEHSIVEFYAMAIESLPVEIAPTLESLKRSHQRNASQLQYAVYVQGSIPSADRPLPHAETSFGRGRSEGPSAIRRALERERDRKADYEAAMLDSCVDPEMKNLIDRDLLPRVSANLTVLELVENRVQR